MSYGVVPAGYRADGTLSAVTGLFSQQVGFVEGGGPHGNDGNVTPYGKWYGLDGQSYCAMGLSWCFYYAGLPLPASTSKGFAYTPSGAAWFQKRGLWSKTPAIGYVPFFQFPGSNRIDHVGFCTAVNRDRSIQTIEFNTSPGSGGSQSNGGGCYRRTRKDYIVGYGVPEYAQENTVTVIPGKHSSEEFMAYDATSMSGGVRVALGDVNGDGKDELITVPGPGYPAHVRIWDISGASPVEIKGFYAFDTNITNGFFVAVDDNGRLIVSSDHGGGPHVKTFTWADITA